MQVLAAELWFGLEQGRTQRVQGCAKDAEEGGRTGEAEGGFTIGVMDSGRLGRVLGIGTRLAAKTLVQAVDAATAPNPAGNATAAEAGGRASTRVADAGSRLGETTRRAREQAQQTRAGVQRGGKKFGEAVWGPFVRLSGVLWLELTGVFFGLFLVTAGVNVWKLRGNLHETASNHDAHVRLLWSVVMAGVFGYFCVSSFVRAKRRERRR